MIDCKPRLALIKPNATKPAVLSQATGESAQLSVSSTFPACNDATVAAKVRMACSIVPLQSQTRLRLPMRSPIRPIAEPRRKVSKDVIACLSVASNARSCVAGPVKRLASASANYRIFG